LDTLRRGKVAERFHHCQRQFSAHLPALAAPCPESFRGLAAYGGLARRQNRLLDFDHMPPRQPKRNCYIVAGSNGAGKTTFATEFLPRYANCPNFINADLIARGLSPFDPDAALARAGRLVLESIQQVSDSHANFAFETTLSGRTYVRVIRHLRKRGYRIHMFYLWVPGPELALARIRDRVAKGGHNVPARDVRRRFCRTLRNLFSLYRPLLDTLRLFDNSTNVPRLVFEDENRKTIVYDTKCYKQVLHSVKS
jgi:predicted ABC-type ATPase